MRTCVCTPHDLAQTSKRDVGQTERASSITSSESQLVGRPWHARTCLTTAIARGIHSNIGLE